jgi:uncharacterized protein (DUF1800 family)
MATPPMGSEQVNEARRRVEKSRSAFNKAKKAQEKRKAVAKRAEQAYDALPEAAAVAMREQLRKRRDAARAAYVAAGTAVEFAETVLADAVNALAGLTIARLE